ncbi:MAG TPA: hypothetical protein VFC19_03890 [Candidatus Limnocylindrales bacterium]|nr:hypothetical protein [Candidatus Limnocylindrales bacterium]
MKEVIINIQSDLLHAMGIWALLVLTGLSAMLLIKSKVYAPESTATRVPSLKSDPVRERRHAEHTRELIRYAQEVTVAAERAAAMARRRREEWLAAQAQLDDAWRAFEASDAEARRFSRAAALPTPKAPRTPAEYAFRERFLHRAAMAACSRKQLSPLDLSDALAHRKGWDPRRHPADQEVVLRRAVRDCMWASYRSAAKRERAAWRSAGLADEAKISLREEARLATARAGQAAAGKPLALVDDTMILPRFKQARPDGRSLVSDTMVLPQFKQARPDSRRAAGDTMVLPTLG